MISQILDINTVKVDQRGIPDTLQATRCIRDAPLVCLSGLRLREVPNNLYTPSHDTADNCSSYTPQQN